MERDHSIFQQTIIDINTGLGKKIGLEVHAISYTNMLDIEYIAATATESVAKKKFIVKEEADDSSTTPYITWNDDTPWNDNVKSPNDNGYREISIGHNIDRKYKLDKMTISGIGDIVSLAPIVGEESYPIVTDLDLHYINFGKGNTLQDNPLYRRLYCDGAAGGAQVRKQLETLLGKYWDAEWMSKINLLTTQWLGWASPAEVIVMFYINEFHQGLFESSSLRWQKTLSSFPLISQGVTAGINIKHHHEMKILSKNLPAAIKVSPYFNSNMKENKSQFPGLNDVTQVCIVTADTSEVKTGKKAIIEAYQNVPGEGDLLAALHPYWIV